LVQVEKPRLYYGWVIIACLFIILVFTSGLGFYNHAVMLQAITSEKGLPITVSSSAVSVFFLVSGLSGILIADQLERFDVRWIVVSGACVAATSLVMIGRVTTELELYLVYGLFGFGFTASGLLPATTLVARWFVRQRAAALSLASTGLSVGGILITPASAVLIREVGINHASWMFGLIYLLGVVPISLLLLRSWPADMGVAADGSQTVLSNHGLGGVVFRDAIRNRLFWAISAAYVLVMMAQVGGIAHHYGVVTERLSPRVATYALTIMPIFSVVGRLLGGVLLNRLPTLGFTFTMMLVQGLALALLAVTTHPWLIFISLGLFGISVGNLLMLQPLLIAEIFGLVSYSRIYAFSNMLTTMGIAAGPAFLGWAYTLQGNYVVPYGVAAGAALSAIAVFIVIAGRGTLPAEVSK